MLEKHFTAIPKGKGAAKHGRARTGQAGQGSAGQGRRAGQDEEDNPGQFELGQGKLGELKSATHLAGRGMAGVRQCKGRAERVRVRKGKECKERQGSARQDRAIPGKAG